MHCIQGIVILFIVSLYFLRCDSIEFGPIQYYKSVTSPDILQTVEGQSLMQCSVLCVTTPGCKSFEFPCSCVHQAASCQCNILSDSVHSTVQLTISSKCYMQMETGGPALDLELPPTVTPTTPLPTTTTTTAGVTSSSATTTSTLATTTSSIPEIKGLMNCPAMGGADKYCLLTMSGWYFYSYDNLFDPGSYKQGPYPFHAVIADYNDLPTIEEIDCLLTPYTMENIEVFSDGRAYIWNNTLTALFSSSVSIDMWLGSDALPTLASPDVKWCCYRNGVSGERYFALASGDLFVASGLYADALARMTDPVVYNGTDVNIWKDLPADVLAVTNKHLNQGNAFVVILGNYSVYDYTYIPNGNAGDGNLVYKGQLNL